MDNTTEPSFLKFIRDLEALSPGGLTDWLDCYLRGGEPSPVCPPARMERQFIVKKVHAESGDLVFRSRIEDSVSLLLESIEPSSGTEQYAFDVLSLVLSFRPRRSKQRLRRLLFNNVLRNSKYDVFDLYRLVIIANCRYDVDEQVKKYFSEDLPKAEDFSRYALTCYKSLISTFDEAAFLFIPKLVRFWQDNRFYARFVDLFEFSIEKLGVDMLAQCYGQLRCEMATLGKVETEQFDTLVFRSLAGRARSLGNIEYVNMLFTVHTGLKKVVPHEIFHELIRFVKVFDQNVIEEILRNYKAGRKEQHGWGFHVVDISREMSEHARSVIYLEDPRSENFREVPDLLVHADEYTRALFREASIYEVSH